MDIVLTPGEHEGEPCVRMVVPARPRDASGLADDLADAVKRDPSTGFMYRGPLLDALKARLAQPVPGGVRYFALVKPDKFAEIEKDVGAAASEEVLVEFAKSPERTPQREGHRRPLRRRELPRAARAR